jgi:outer membrane protein OmpA-like peptidoglycan-associated protein
VEEARWSKDGQVVVPLSSSVLFAGDRADLRPAAKKSLDKVVVLLNRTYPKATAQVAGYAATVPGGSEDKALALSSARARAVANYLRAHGVAPSRLEAVGRGTKDPVASNSTEAGRQANRRVVITCTLN